jgi:uncharacterized membrane protein (DUF373 family)
MGQANDSGTGDPSPGVRRASRRGIRSLVWLLEHAQDVVTAVVGGLLIVIAGVLLVTAMASFIHELTRSLSADAVTAAAANTVSQVLLVLILVEIVYTVVLSLQVHRLQALPFLVIGLVAVIRKILLLLSGQEEVGTAELALLIALVAVFVAGLIAVSQFDRSTNSGPPSDQRAKGR